MSCYLLSTGNRASVEGSVLNGTSRDEGTSDPTAKYFREGHVKAKYISLGCTSERKMGHEIMYQLSKNE